MSGQKQDFGASAVADRGSREPSPEGLGPNGLRSTSAESAFIGELSSLLNRYSRENGSNTPDFLLAEYLECQLRTWNQYVTRREEWYGRSATSGAREEAGEPSDCQHCDGFGKSWNNGDNTSGQWMPCEVCKDERGRP